MTRKKNEVEESFEDISKALAEAMQAQDDCVGELASAIQNDASRMAITKIEKKLIVLHEHLAFCKKETAKFIKAYAQYAEMQEALMRETERPRTLN